MRVILRDIFLSSKAMCDTLAPRYTPIYTRTDTLSGHEGNDRRTDGDCERGGERSRTAVVLFAAIAAIAAIVVDVAAAGDGPGAHNLGDGPNGVHFMFAVQARADIHVHNLLVRVAHGLGVARVSPPSVRVKPYNAFGGRQRAWAAGQYDARDVIILCLRGRQAHGESGDMGEEEPARHLNKGRKKKAQGSIHPYGYYCI